MLHLQNQPRVFRLIDDAIERFQLDLSGLRVLTEAASGAFVVTSLVAARAGADMVHAITGDSPHGRAGEVIEYTREWAHALGIADRIALSTDTAIDIAPAADIVTNLGFVRPVDTRVVARLPPRAVVSLMCEPWELRAHDVDLRACSAAGIPVVGTRETHPDVSTFDYVGVLSVKLLLETGVEGYRGRVAVIGSDPFGHAVASKIAALGAVVERLQLCDRAMPLDDAFGPVIENADALVLAEHRDDRELVGMQLGVRPRRFRRGCALIHVAGNVDHVALEREGVKKHPARQVESGYMTLTTAYVGPRPVIDLHTAGLRVAEIAARCRLRGGRVDDAIEEAEQSGLGLRVD